MADLSAVLRKTIDGLPSATPQLRAKVYEKARLAIGRQISAANPPLDGEVVQARQRALEEAIASTEAHYAAQERGETPTESPPPAPAVARAMEEARGPAFVPPPPVERVAPPARGFEAEPAPPREHEDMPGRVGEIGPAPEQSQEPEQSQAPEPIARDEPPRAIGGFAPPIRETGGPSDPIPAADMEAPRYAPPARERRSRKPLVAGVAALLLIGAVGTVGYLFSDDIRTALTGTSDVAVAPPADPAPETPDEADVAAVETPAPGASPETGVEGGAGPAPVEAPGATSQRRFTQRLLADGTEVDEGQAESEANAFDEGTDVAAASPATAEQPGAPATTAPATEPDAQTAAIAPEGEPTAVPVGQRAVFYEERSQDEPGSQQGGNVVWSVVNEPPADGQAPEPAIRAVADVPEENLRLTMTIRRNGDETLPASHVIELLFDVPDDFTGGGIENVQRLALKPTEQARGEPLIGVAGKISDGFFIIALNDLQQAVENNLNLMQREEWIDIPVAYSSGQRALMSLEKGIPGDRVFEEVLTAWASRT